MIFGRKKRLLKNMGDAVDMVKIGMAKRLLSKYRENYGEEIAAPLAAAVTNELFSDKPSSVKGEDFLASNRDIVENELSNLHNDKAVCNIVTQAIRVKVTLAVCVFKWMWTNPV